MSERTARLMEQGLEQYDTAEEAWDSLKELRDDTDWDLDAVQPSETSASEFRYPLAADD